MWKVYKTSNILSGVTGGSKIKVEQTQISLRFCKMTIGIVGPWDIHRQYP